MTHEFKQLIQGYLNARHLGLSCVMATVVDLDGSSYRRPGVRMLLNEQGHMTGAVSGGCVEKEIMRQADSVFKTGDSKLMTYDGRYRLGCEGTLYILIETFSPSEGFLEAFSRVINDRKHFKLRSTYRKTSGIQPGSGSFALFNDTEMFPFNNRNGKVKYSISNERVTVFKQSLKPSFRLMIIGAEHDAGQLSLMAASLGWEVTVVISPSNPQVLADFPGAIELLKVNAADLALTQIDSEIGVMLMSHNYVKDLEFLFRLQKARPAYIGLLGPSNRRERMLNDLIEKYPDIDENFFDLIFGPAGLNIGAETPQEIALSICSEILSITREQHPKSLKDKLGSIHLNTKL